MATTLISASAGTGKTQAISNLIVERLLGGLDPARLVATTFTRKAAAELAERIRSRLVFTAETTGVPADRRDAILDRLDLAAIGTVHAIAHRFLCRHALRLGLSPRLEVLDEGEDTGAGSRHLGRLLQERQPDGWSDFTALCARLSLANPVSVALDLLQTARANALTPAQVARDLRDSAKRWSAVVGKADPEALGLPDLKRLAATAVRRLERMVDTTQVTANTLATLRPIARHGGQTWADLAGLAKLAAGRRSGADAHLDDLRTLGSGVRTVPDLHADLRAFAELAGSVVTQLDQAYTAYKVERGLVDFVDLERRFLDLVRDETLRPNLAAEIGCFVVDEFQDTNPIQLAIFRAMQAVAGETVWVGDRKQAIFGFRGTDAGLVDGVWRSTPAEQRWLDVTYRNAPAIVAFVNALFGPIFGEDTQVTAARSDEPGRVECWGVSGNKDQTMAALAGGIAAVLDERPTLARRDLAVLVRTNHRADAVAAALHAAGIAAIVPRSGLLQTREGAAIVAGLRVVADRRDSLACAEVCHLLETDPETPTPPWFAQRLAEVATDQHQAAPFEDSVSIKALAALEPAGLAAPDLVLAVSAALDLPGRIAAWGDPHGRAANLDALVALAQDYEDDARRDGRPATPSGLVRHLDQLATSGADVIPVGEDADAVQVLTYFKAKGLEWPVTICFDLDAKPKTRLFTPVVTGGDPTAADPLAGRRLRYWPWPFGSNVYSFVPLDQGSGLLEDALTTKEGQASQALDAEEDRRLLYVGCTRARDLLVLVLPAKEPAWLASLGYHWSDVIDADAGLVHHRTVEATGRDASPSTTATWILESPRAIKATSFPPRFSSPSAQVAADAATIPAATVQEAQPTGSAPLVPTGSVEADQLGNAVHAYFAGISARAHLAPAVRIALAEDALRSWGASGCLSASGLSASADGFLAWVQARWPGARLLTEIPIEGPRSAGGEWRGILDALVVDGDGKPLALIDHKTTGGPAASPADALDHAPQLAAYQEAVGLPVEVWIHQLLAGRMVRMNLR